MLQWYPILNFTIIIEEISSQIEKKNYIEFLAAS